MIVRNTINILSYLNATNMSAKYVFLRHMCTNTKINQKLSNAEKRVRVAIIGVPNAGKSTFINNLINHRVKYS